MRTYIFIFSLLVGVALQEGVAAPLSPGQLPPGLKAGAAKVDITPRGPVPLGGYGKRRGRPSKGVHDPVYARAMVLDDGYTRAAICNTDLVITTRALREAIWQRVEGLDLDALLLFATHNHSGPGGYVQNLVAQVIAMGRYDGEIFETLAERVAGGIRGALKDLRPAAIGWGTLLETHLSVNRREPDGPIDPEVGLVKIVGQGGRPIALLVNFAAHPTLLGPENMHISGDFPGYLAKYLEEKGGVVLFANGASGDIAPRMDGEGGGFQQARAMGKSLAARVLETLPRIQTRRDVRIRHAEKVWRLPRRPDLSPILRFPVLTRVLNLLADIWLPDETLLQVLALDHLLLMGVPCDMGVEVGLRIKQEVGPGQVYLISQANDYIGYVMDRSQYEKGGYEAQMSFYGPGLGDLMTEELLGMLKGLGLD